MVMGEWRGVGESRRGEEGGGDWVGGDGDVKDNMWIGWGEWGLNCGD